MRYVWSIRLDQNLNRTDQKVYMNKWRCRIEITTFATGEEKDEIRCKIALNSDRQHSQLSLDQAQAIMKVKELKELAGGSAMKARKTTLEDRSLQNYLMKLEYEQRDDCSISRSGTGEREKLVTFGGRNCRMIMTALQKKKLRDYHWAGNVKWKTC